MFRSSQVNASNNLLLMYCCMHLVRYHAHVVSMNGLRMCHPILTCEAMFVENLDRKLHLVPELLKLLLVNLVLE